MPIKNYFALTLRFNPADLNVLKPDLQVTRVQLRDTMQADEFESVRRVEYTYHGVEFRTEYYVRSDSFRSLAPNQAVCDRTFLGPGDGADTLLDAVQDAIRSFKEEAFRGYLSWLVNHAFSSPYSYRNVEVLEKDHKKMVAKILVDGLIKMVVAYRFETRNKYIMRIAGREGMVTLEKPSLPTLGREMRPVVHKCYRIKNTPKEKAPQKGKGRFTNMFDQ